MISMGMDSIVYFINRYKFAYITEQTDIWGIKEFTVHFKYREYIMGLLLVTSREVDQQGLITLLHKLYIPVNVISEYCMDNDIDVINNYFKSWNVLEELGA